MKFMSKKHILAIPIMILILLLVPLAQVSAAHPYIGGYLYRSGWGYWFGWVYETDKVILAVDFGNTNPSHIPSNETLWGGTSVAGANAPKSPSGYVYQNGVQLARNNYVSWYPQYWYLDSFEDYGNIGVVGEGDYCPFYCRTDIIEGGVTYKLYVYPTFSMYDRDSPLIWQWSHETDDSNFLVGNRYHWTHIQWYKFFQFGVESTWNPITATWQMLNCHAAYYDYDENNWCYSKGAVCWSDYSWITYVGDDSVTVGLENYTGVGLWSAIPDCIWWEMDDPPDPIGHGDILWTEMGIVNDGMVSRPYQ